MDINFNQSLNCFRLSVELNRDRKVEVEEDGEQGHPGDSKLILVLSGGRWQQSTCSWFKSLGHEKLGPCFHEDFSLMDSPWAWKVAISVDSSLKIEVGWLQSANHSPIKNTMPFERRRSESLKLFRLEFSSVLKHCSFEWFKPSEWSTIFPIHWAFIWRSAALNSLITLKMEII